MIKEIKANEALTWENPPDNPPDGAHLPVVDPYEGCTIQCPYCYLHDDELWKNKDILVKLNMPELIYRDEKLIRQGVIDLNWGGEESLTVGSKCDPYMPIERKYYLTRKCLIALSELHIPTGVGTKSDPEIISKDLDIMKDFQGGFKIVMGLTNLHQLEEAERCDKTKNIEFVHYLHSQGIEVWVFIMPVLPGITDVPLMIEALPKDVRIFLYSMTLQEGSNRVMEAYIKEKYPSMIDIYMKILKGEKDPYYLSIKKQYKDNPRFRFLDYD